MKSPSNFVNFLATFSDVLSVGDVKKNQKKYFPKFLTASLVIHGLIVTVTSWVASNPHLFEAPKTVRQTVEVEFQSEPKTKPEEIKAKQVVDQDIKPLNDEKPLKEAFLSRHDQRVEKETVATNKGEFQNVKAPSQKAVTSPNLAEQLRAKPAPKAADKPVVKAKQEYIKEGHLSFDPFGEVKKGISQKSFEDAA
ncbi:MAG: hypothetical protein V4736_03400, partial [Bdellovibrionota bacterium]